MKKEIVGFFYKKRLQSDVDTSYRLIKRHTLLSEFSLPKPKVSPFFKKKSVQNFLAKEDI